MDPYLREAIELAKESMTQNKGGPFGAVIVKEESVIGTGTNHVTSTCDPTAHAEIMAIRDACQHTQDFSLEGCTLYSSCEPCPMCLSAIYWARINTVYYASTKLEAAIIGFDDVWIEQELQKVPENRSITMIHQPSKEAIALFQGWEDKGDKVGY